MYAVAISGQTYGDADATHLFGGSGGGGGDWNGGGSGAGGIKIVAGNTLTIGGDIYAVGGKGGSSKENGNNNNEARRSGGSGSGGSIYLKAANVVINAGVTISANGGAGANLITASHDTHMQLDSDAQGASGGGGGRIFIEGTASLVNSSSVLNENITAAGGQSAGGRHGSAGTVKILRSQVTSLVFTSGLLTIDTDMATITHSDGSFMAGTLENKSFVAADNQSYPYKVCTFTADTINLGASVIVNLQGTAGLSLRDPKQW